MLSQAQRTTILELNTQKVTKREIARILGISRLTVRKVLRSNSSAVPEHPRAEKAEPHRQQILELLNTCKGNLVRVHEELVAGGAVLSYPALTAFCRRQGIGQSPIVPAGQYHFEPGEEMQHDTSPHEVQVDGKKRKVQTASGVLCYSRMLFFQCSPTFQRFDCKVFLTDALRHAGGVPECVMIDNTHVVVLRGTGRDMVPVPEMAAFAERFGFRFVAHQVAHQIGDARLAYFSPVIEEVRDLPVGQNTISTCAGVVFAVPLDQTMRLYFALIIAELIQAVACSGEFEGGQDGVMDLLGSTPADRSAAVQQNLREPDPEGSYGSSTCACRGS